MKYKRLIILAICTFLCCCVFAIFEEEHTPVKNSVEDQEFRLSVEVSSISKLSRDDHCFNISITYLKEGYAILYHAPPPYSLTLTSLDTGEKINFFSHPTIEERTMLSSAQIYSSKVLLSDFSNITVFPGNYEAIVSCSFDFLETNENPRTSLDVLSELDNQERQHFSNSISLVIQIE